MPKISTFLGHVLPGTPGSIALGYGVGGPETTRFVSSIDVLIAKIGELFGKDTYFTPARYKKQADGKWRRKAFNCTGKRCFAIDVDLNHETKPSYSTKEEAIVASFRAFAVIGLPAPSYVLDSGGGLHLYWALDQDVEPDVWKPMADALKTAWIAADPKLACDTTRISDLAGYLRLPASWNNKRESLCEFYEVNGSHAGVEMVYALDVFSSLSVAPSRSLTLSSKPRPKMKIDRVGGPSLVPESKGETTEITRPMDLVHECRPLEVLSAGDQSYEAWQGLARLYARAGEAGREAFHAASSTYKGYDWAETDRKFTDALNTSFTSPSCAQLRMWSGQSIDACRSCPLFQAQGEGGKPAALQAEFIDPLKNRNTMPSSLDHEVESLAQARMAMSEGNWAPLERLGITVPKRLKGEPNHEFPTVYINEDDGALYAQVLVKVGKEEVPEQFEITRTPFWFETLITERNADSSSPKFGARFVQARLREDGDWEGRFVVIPAKDIHGSAQIVLQCLKSYGLGVKFSKPTHPAMGPLHAYVSHAMAKHGIERAFRKESSYGWRFPESDDLRAFVIGDRRYTAGGTTVLVEQENGAKDMNSKVPQLGSLDKAKEISRKAMARGEFPLQFIMLCSLGAPLLHMTNVEGALVAVAGSTGRGKTAAMSYACSFYGSSRPGSLTATGVDTQKSIMHMLGLMSNLPVFIDETTSMSDEAIADTLLQITQGGENNRMEASANRLRERNRWQTIAIASANKSVASAVKAESFVAEAQRMRAIDLIIEENVEPFYSKGSNAFLDEVLMPSHKHHGLLGVEFIKYVLNNYASTREMVVRAEHHLRNGKSILSAGSSDPFRVWRGVISVAIVAAAIGNNLGFWEMSQDFTDKLVSRLSNAANAMKLRTTANPGDYINRFLDYSQNSVIIDAVTTRDGTTLTGSALDKENRVMSIDGRKPLSHSPMWSTKARITLTDGDTKAVCEIAIAAFRKWCKDEDIDYDYARAKITEAGLLLKADGRTTLGRGAPLPSAHSTVSSIGGEALPPTTSLTVQLRLARPYEMGKPPEYL